MDIPMIGNTASRTLAQQFHSSLDEFEAAVCGGFDFTQLPDFGDISICEGKRKARFDVNQNELSRLPVVEISGIEPLTSYNIDYGERHGSQPCLLSSQS